MINKRGGNNKQDLGDAFQKKKRTHGDDDLWLEHIEDELEPNLDDDLTVLLKNSRGDRKIVDGLIRTRRAIKQADEVSLPESGQYYDDLHDRIMASIEPMIHQTTPDDPQPLVRRPARRTKYAWPSFIGALSISALVASVGWFVFKTGHSGAQLGASLAHELLNEDGVARGIASASDVVPSFSQSMVGFESESDLLAQVAADRMKGLDGDQLGQVLESLKN